MTESRSMRDGQRLFAGAPPATLGELGDILDIGVLAIDGQGVVTGWNGWLERITGIAADDAIGKSITDDVLKIRPAGRASLARAARGEVVVMSHALHEFLVEARPPAGHGRFARMQQSVRLVPLRSGDSAPTGAVAFIEDVTERVAREDDLRRALENAQQANQAKSDFLAAMSHELRTPIGAVSGYADLLALEIFGPVSPPQLEQLTRVKNVASHLLRIVDQILNAARIGAGREEMHLTDVDAVALAEDALVAVEPLAVQKGLRVLRTLPSAPIALRTDEVKVRQILINLLGNAIKFTDLGEIEVRLDHCSGDATLSFTVADSGSGIAPGDQERVFDAFTRLPGAPGQLREGTGLGLSVSRSLARLLGGDLTVSSELGVGSRFTLVLPMKPAEAAERRSV